MGVGGQETMNRVAGHLLGKLERGVDDARIRAGDRETGRWDRHRSDNHVREAALRAQVFLTSSPGRDLALVAFLRASPVPASTTAPPLSRFHLIMSSLPSAA